MTGLNSLNPKIIFLDPTFCYQELQQKKAEFMNPFDIEGLKPSIQDMKTEANK